MIERRRAFVPDNTVAGEALTIRPGTAEWYMLVSARAARADRSENSATEALMRMCQYIGPALPAALRMPWLALDGLRTFDRSELIEGLRWLKRAGVAPVLLNQLCVALEELDRGMDQEIFEPAPGGARGGKTPLGLLEWKAAVVKAVDELAIEFPKRAALRQALSDLGFSLRTVEGYRKQVAEGPSALSEPLSFFLEFGGRPPAEVLRMARTALDASNG
jgi:hypothetical protein